MVWGAVSVPPRDGVGVFQTGSPNGNGRLCESLKTAAAATESCHIPGDTNECETPTVVGT